MLFECSCYMLKDANICIKLHQSFVENVLYKI